MLSTPSIGNILIVDDDENITELLQVNLRSEGYTVAVEKVAENVDRSVQGATRLVIVDAMHQDYSGMDLIFDFKDDPATEHIGIILYSDIKSERMVIDALDAGADDYIVKPFSLREMVARVKSVLRRHKAPVAPAGQTLTFENMTVDLTTQTVKIDGQPVGLSRTE
ncbi:MAG: response regulator transcription factor, partial [Muribaculaceae bacterium]|nr:response regulator transcription factor [Muribaculaceae bacterium]